MEEITFEDDSLFVVASHRGRGEFEIFTVWARVSGSKDFKDYDTKVYRLTPVNGELVLTRVGLKTRPNDGGLDITGIN